MEGILKLRIFNMNDASCFLYQEKLVHQAGNATCHLAQCTANFTAYNLKISGTLHMDWLEFEYV